MPFVLRKLKRCDDFHFDEDVLRQGLDGNAGTSRVGSKVLCIDCVESGKVAHIRQTTGGLEDLLCAAAGSFLPFDSTGIDFAMTALFLVIFVEQWEKAHSRLPALLGLGITLISLIVVGSDRFLLFSMAGILAALLLFRKEISK